MDRGKRGMPRPHTGAGRQAETGNGGGTGTYAPELWHAVQVPERAVERHDHSVDELSSVRIAQIHHR